MARTEQPPRAPLLVPQADLVLPLPERQFPYRPAGPSQVPPAQAARELAQANAAISQAIGGCERMLWKAVRDRFWGMCGPDMEVAVQDVRLHLAMYALPRFDRHRGIIVSTYIHACVRSQIRHLYSAFFARQRHVGRLINFTDAKGMLSGTAESHHPIEDIAVGADAALDQKIERLAADVRTNPEKYLLPAQAAAFRALMAGPTGRLTKDIAKEAGYASSITLCAITKRMRKRIAKLSIADWEPTC